MIMYPLTILAGVYQFLSGNVPGGFILLIFVLFILNLIIYFLYLKSGLFDRSLYKKKFIQYNLFVLTSYVILWVLLQSPRLPRSVLIEPFQKGDSLDFALTEAIEEQLRPELSKKYRLHPWEWFYLTANTDSLRFARYRQSLADRLAIDVRIAGQVIEETDNYKIDLDISSTAEANPRIITANSLSKAVQGVIQAIKQQTDLFNDTESTAGEVLHPAYYMRLSRAKVAMLNGEYDLAGQILKSDTLYQNRLIQAQCYLRQGIQQEGERTTANPMSQEEVNLFFRRVEQLMLPYSIRNEDTAEINLILGQMYLHRQQYETADICLKKAFSQNRYDARIFFYLSFLIPERFRELNYKSRAELLEYSLELDPGYAECVIELAQEWYEKGSGTASTLSTRSALEILENFLTINSDQLQVMKLLGRIYLQSKDNLKAIDLFERILIMEPDLADNYYNLGICYFNRAVYDTSRQYFEQAIRLNDHRDSYLYLGAIYKIQGDTEKALYYFRERIKRKSGDDDYYAKEAMLGVRVILEKQNNDSTAATRPDSN